MAERDLLYGRKAWFADARTPVRRMGVSQHPEEGVVVVSLWQGEVCTGTFRLPLADAPRLISALADSLGAALPPAGAVGGEPAVPGPNRGWIGLGRWAARLRERRAAQPPTLRRVK